MYRYINWFTPIPQCAESVWCNLLRNHSNVEINFYVHLRFIFRIWSEMVEVVPLLPRCGLYINYRFGLVSKVHFCGLLFVIFSLSRQNIKEGTVCDFICVQFCYYLYYVNTLNIIYLSYMCHFFGFKCRSFLGVGGCLVQNNIYCNQIWYFRN
jgi:hypothetical protein